MADTALTVVHLLLSGASASVFVAAWQWLAAGDLRAGHRRRATVAYRAASAAAVLLGGAAVALEVTR